MEKQERKQSSSAPPEQHEARFHVFINHNRENMRGRRGFAVAANFATTTEQMALPNTLCERAVLIAAAAMLTSTPVAVLIARRNGHCRRIDPTQTVHFSCGRGRFTSHKTGGCSMIEGYDLDSMNHP
jgi:hypothetical protein